MEKTSISKLSRCWLHGFGYLVRSFLKTKNAGGSAFCTHRDLLPEEAIVTHSITCQGRDHVVHIQSGRQNLVIVNVHFKPEFTLRQLRDRLHFIHPHWPSYLNGVVIILGDFNICDPEEGHSPMAIRGRLLCSTRSFHMSLRLVNLITRGGTPQFWGSYAFCQGLIVFLSIWLWPKHLIFTVPLTSSRTWEIGPFYASSFKSQQLEDTRANVFPAGCPNIPFFCSLVQRLHDDHRFYTDPSGALAEFKVLLQKAKRLTSRELSRKTPDCIGAKLPIASTVLRASRNRHLGTLMRCCEAWKPIEDRFDPMSFESVDFQRRSQIIAKLTCENLAEREAEITNLPWDTDRKRQRFSQMQKWTTCMAYKKTCAFSLSAVTDEEGHPLENER